VGEMDNNHFLVVDVHFVWRRKEESQTAMVGVLLR
jgi:hypothetical protein